MTRTATMAAQLAAAFAAGLTGALAAQAAGLPIPFLLGSLFATAALSLTLYARRRQRLWFPQPLRRASVGVIGTMIGTTFDPDLLATLGSMAVTLAALTLFIVMAQAVGYGVYRGLGRYDPVTARYAAMPGGLIEAVSLGEKAGGDVETLSLQHFLRIVLVVMAVPTIIYFWTGHSVGSSAGQTLQTTPAQWTDWAAFAIVVPAGLALGRLLRLPAGIIMGPLLLSAGLHAAGIIALSGPPLLLNGAQLMVGTGLGVMFARSTLRRLALGAALGTLAVGLMLALGAGFAALLAPHVPMSFEVLLISFAPGGVSEMSLIALSLGVSPVIVAGHHLFRIAVTVLMAGLLARKTPPSDTGD